MTGEAINERIRVIGLGAGLPDAYRLVVYGYMGRPARGTSTRTSAGSV